MNVTLSERAEAAFYEALELPPAERAAFLERACGDDAAARAEVCELLEAHDRGGDLLEENIDGSPNGAREAERQVAEQPGDRIDDFCLLEQIGEGGFGVVWVAEQERPVRRRVALKIIKLGMDTKGVIARFEQERQALAMMDHPNIAKVFDAGTTVTGRPYFVMELVRGIKITDYCDEALLSTRERVELFIQVCSAIQHAHQKGIIHRDLKPSNILVTLHDTVAVPKVIDFGIAKATQQQRLTNLTIYTLFEQMIGTPLYMSPEQAQMSGLDIDTRSDIYTLGVLLYELLTGQTPFPAEQLLKSGMDEMRRVIREQEPQKPSTVVSTLQRSARATLAKRRQSDAAKLIGQIRGDLDWIVMKALEKDRSRRYGTATEFARDLERHLADEPVSARAPSKLYRFGRFARRNKVGFAAAVAVSLSILVGAIGIIWQAIRAEREANRAKSFFEELRSSAPAFAEQARAFAANQSFDKAIERIDYAMRLRPDVAAYSQKKGDYLQCQFKFREAQRFYEQAARLDPLLASAHASAKLCEELAAEADRGEISRESFIMLLRSITTHGRPAGEAMPVARIVGAKNRVLLDYWRERLADLPLPRDRSLSDCLTESDSGELALDLRRTGISDLQALAGAPLASLNLDGCVLINDLSPLRGMPLRVLDASGTDVSDLTPLSGMNTLAELHLALTKVENVSPLEGLALEVLDLSRTRVADLSALRRMPLRTLHLSHTPVEKLDPLAHAPLRGLDIMGTKINDLGPLSGMPLAELDCSGIPARDFSVLAQLPLISLTMTSTAVQDLSILRKLPLKTLHFDYCTKAWNFGVLSDLLGLEMLALPSVGGLAEADFAALAKLREHPSLKSIQVRGGEWNTRERFYAQYLEWQRRRQAQAQARVLAENGAFADAVPLIRESIEAETGPESYTGQLLLGVALLAAGDQSGYQSTCNDMIAARWPRGQGDEPTARLCMASPRLGAPLIELRRLIPHVALMRRSSPYFAFFVCTNGIYEFRAGRYAEAIETLREVETTQFPAPMTFAAAALAMANHKLGYAEIAKSELLHAQKLLRTFWPRTEGGPRVALGDSLYAYLLVKEAEEMILRN